MKVILLPAIIKVLPPSISMTEIKMIKSLVIYFFTLDITVKNS